LSFVLLLALFVCPSPPPPAEAVSEGAVTDKYDVGDELGRGTFSIVKRGKSKTDGKDYAIKFIQKKFVDAEDLALLSREIDIMKKVDHGNILRLIEIFETSTELSLVMELVVGGELFFQIVEKGSYSEAQAAAIVKQIVAGVQYLHELNICHRDLKPENLLCTTQEGEDVPAIKIADFGLSKMFAEGEQLQTSCGTPDYAAPEVLMGEKAYDNSVDMWSVGVITYVLLCGFPPFFAQTQPALFEKIIACDFDFPSPEWDSISDKAKEFIRNLLVSEPEGRLTAKKAMKHPFLDESQHDADASVINIQASMRDYMGRRKGEREGVQQS
jgi:calcium/calmodulin-dependent protein kinase I